MNINTLIRTVLDNVCESASQITVNAERWYLKINKGSICFVCVYGLWNHLYDFSVKIPVHMRTVSKNYSLQLFSFNWLSSQKDWTVIPEYKYHVSQF